ncbi:MAG: 3'-5' exonuclease [Verrucomicrobia bacterium RIFCSPLOWO2_12_FULL_64_8]|nr:MAG: 3'-5' exonuclease [Verrucomicrobia bacterium RIFCSPLOWO2_12_FULL_64_8]
MPLRERLLALLRGAGYAPLDEAAIARALDLSKKERGTLAFEVRRLLAAGEIVRIKQDRLCLPRDADLVTGRINFRQGGSAYVVPEGRANEPEKPAIQIAAEDTGVALHGDRVVVRLSDEVTRPRGRRPGGEPTGRVIRILERGRTTLTGNLQRSKLFFYIVPDDPRYFHDIYVPDPAKSGLRPVPAVGDKVVVQLHEWKQRHVNPEGVIIARLGRTHEPGAELAAIFLKLELPHSFPEDVEREEAALPGRVQPAELAGRLDCRTIPTFTIDPDDAKDFDDALSVEELPGGDVRVGVHIADVSAYVKPGTALDREAQRRGNSTYLVGTVVPMLPEKLSNGLCSLVEAEDRLTKAVFLTFHKHRLQHAEYANTVIRSRKRLTYHQAYALLKEDSLDKIRRLPLPPAHQTGSTGRALSALSREEIASLQRWIRQLWDLAFRLRRERMRAGSLDLDMPEVKIFVDAQGYADRLERIEHDESHQLIEEFMLAANEAVARVARKHNLPSLYRVHDDPDQDRLEELRQVLGTFGVTAGDLMQRGEMVRVLAALAHHPQGYTLRIQLLRSLKKAVYRATPDGHYGLAKKDYTHFTSPIRRYSDLVVHRVFDHFLVKQLGRPAPRGHHFGYNPARMDSLAEHLSLTEQNSMEAERESQKVKLLEFFEREVAKKKKTPFAAVITDVRNHGLFVELPDAMTFGLIHLSTLRDDLYLLNNAGTALIGRSHKRRLELGQKVNVVTERVDRFKRQIDFCLAP